VTVLFRPDASIWSDVSRVTLFCMPETVTVAQWPVIVTVLETPLMLTSLLLHVSVLVSLMPDTLSCPPGGAAVTVFAGPPLGTFGWMLGMLVGKLGTLMLGILMIGKLCVALLDMYTPTPAAMAMKTAAPIPSTTHGMPADVFCGGGVHGAP